MNLKSLLKSDNFGVMMFVMGQFTLWPQAIHTYNLGHAGGLSLITCVMGIFMSLFSLIYSWNTNAKWYRWDNISNMTASTILLLEKIMLPT